MNITLAANYVTGQPQPVYTLNWPDMSLATGLVLDNSQIVTVEDLSLQGFSGSISAQTVNLMTSFNLPALARVGGFHFDTVPVLGSVSLPALALCTGDLIISHASIATMVNLPALGMITGGKLSVSQSNFIDTINLPALQSISGNFELLIL